MAANILQFDTRTPAFERRRQERVPVPNIQALPSGGAVNIINMSRRGMAIETQNQFTIGGDYLFELCDEGRSLVVEGRVRWSRRVLQALPQQLEPSSLFRTGVAFSGIQSRDLRPNARHLNQIPATPSYEQVIQHEAAHDRIDRLTGATNIEDSGEFLLDLLEPAFERLILLKINHGEIQVWMGRGKTLLPEKLRNLTIDFDQPSIFLHLREGGRLFFGSLPPMIAHRRLTQCWHGSLMQECAVFPIWIKTRLVGFLYADAGDEALTARHLGQLQQASQLFTESILNQILSRKAHRQAAPN